MKKPLGTLWRTLASRLVYENRWLALREDRVELPNGRETIYGVVRCGECVGVLPFLDAETVLLVRQYRYVAGQVTREMPTGGAHPGEPVEAAAQREMSGESLEPVSAPSDDTEFLEVRPFAFVEALRMVLAGKITDSMTIIAVLHVDRSRRGGTP